MNQTRMWLASQWSVQAGFDWREGAEHFERHLLDGSAAANLLWWRWTVGTGTGTPYGFSRWSVRKRAPGLCETCPLNDHCPIAGWPDGQGGPAVIDQDPRLRADPDADGDPALETHPRPAGRGGRRSPSGRDRRARPGMAPAAHLKLERRTWPWLVRPGSGPVTSCISWRRSSGAPSTGAAHAGGPRRRRL